MNPDQHMEQFCLSDPSLTGTRARGGGGKAPPALPSHTDSLVGQHRLLPLPEGSFTLEHIYPTYTRLSFTTKPDGNAPQSSHYKHYRNESISNINMVVCMAGKVNNKPKLVVLQTLILCSNSSLSYLYFYIFNNRPIKTFVSNSELLYSQCTHITNTALLISAKRNIDFVKFPQFSIEV